jgi:arsenate reductase
MTAHWGVDDPALVEGPHEDQVRAFDRALRELEARIALFTSLPLASLDATSLRERLRDIGRTRREEGRTR